VVELAPEFELDHAPELELEPAVVAPDSELEPAAADDPAPASAALPDDPALEPDHELDSEPEPATEPAKMNVARVTSRSSCYATAYNYNLFLHLQHEMVQNYQWVWFGFHSVLLNFV
jgi:hypothetical protein